jgi:PemK-like, MazF-like toxin of type II toxin-antitoxin system
MKKWEEIWESDLNPSRVREQCGTRPVLIVSVDPFNQGPSGLVIVLPISTVAEIKTIFEPWQLAGHLETARQSAPFDPDDSEDEDPEMVDLDRKLEISRSAADLLLVEQARGWLLGEGD